MTRYYLAGKTDAILPRSGGTSLGTGQRHLVNTVVRHKGRDHPEVMKTPNPDAWPLELELDHQVAFAQAYLDHDGFTALIAEPFFDAHETVFREALTNLAPCNLRACRGKRPRSYVFGNIRHRFLAHAACDFAQTRFTVHEGMSFSRHHTAVMRGDKPSDSAPASIVSDIAFANIAALTRFWSAEENWLNTIHPAPLYLTVSPPPIFHFASTDIWLREDLALALGAEKQPGMHCPGPPIDVFGP